MKAIATLFVIALAFVSAVAAAGDDLTPKDLTMAQTDTRVVQYCVNNVVPASTTVVVGVKYVCQDQDGFSGCGAGDIMNPAAFWVDDPVDIVTVGGAGCTDVYLHTNNALGLYYYNINGQLAQSEITSETGSVFVPEFGIVAAVGILAGAGYFIAKKRK